MVLLVYCSILRLKHAAHVTNHLIFSDNTKPNYYNQT